MVGRVRGPSRECPVTRFNQLYVNSVSILSGFLWEGLGYVGGTGRGKGLHVLGHGKPSSLLGAAAPSSMVALEAPMLLPKTSHPLLCSPTGSLVSRGEVGWK